MNDEEENAADLSFGPEFSGEVECLSDAEVTTILERKMSDSRTVNEQLRRTFDYVKRTIAGRDVDSVRKESIHLRQALEELRFENDDKLHTFEIASLANLMSKDSEPEEARALIPSLRRVPDEAIVEILSIVDQCKEV